MQHQLFSEILKEPLLVIDAGGRDGFKLLPAFHPQMNVHAFEPDKNSIAELKQIAKSDSFQSFTVHEKGLSDANGETTFYATAHPGMSSMLEPDTEKYNEVYGSIPGSENWVKSMIPQGKTTISTETLDHFSAQQKIRRIDFLKLDTQGAELKILHGSSGLLDEKNVGVIFCEVVFIPTYKGQPVFSEIDLYLKSKGYRFVDLRIYPEAIDKAIASSARKMNEKPKYCISCDAVYVPEFDKNSDVNFIRRVALLLSGLGYYSDSKHLLKTFCAMKEEEAEEFQRASSKGNSENRFKNFIKRWTPPALAKLYSKNKQ